MPRRDRRGAKDYNRARREQSAARRRAGKKARCQSTFYSTDGSGPREHSKPCGLELIEFTGICGFCEAENASA